MTNIPNIVLIICDAMRKDVLRIYGGRSIAPNIDGFCQEATAYPNAVAPAPWTIPSHASLFLGKSSSEHGVHESHDKKARDIVGFMQQAKGETIAERLRKEGYSTIGVSANRMLSVHPGFDRGFDFFTSNEEGTMTKADREIMRKASTYGRSVGTIIWYFLRRRKLGELFELYSAYRRTKARKKLLNFPKVKGGDGVVRTVIERSVEAPFFLFVNFLEMHDPYTRYEQRTSNKGGFPSVQIADLFDYKKIPNAEMSSIHAGYYRSVSYLDLFFGQLIAHLKKENLYENTLIIVTSDHGQALKEKGFFGHGTFLHDEILEVPLIVKYPKSTKITIGPGYQTLTDIPILMQSVVQGESRDVMSRRVVTAESFGTQNRPPILANDPAMSARIEDKRKIVDTPRKAVYKDGYKLVARWEDRTVEELTFEKKVLDPDQNRNLTDSLLEELEHLAKSVAAPVLSRAILEPEEESQLMENLRKLGYL